MDAYQQTNHNSIIYNENDNESQMIPLPEQHSNLTETPLPNQDAPSHQEDELAHLAQYTDSPIFKPVNFIKPNEFYTQKQPINEPAMGFTFLIGLGLLMRVSREQ